LTSCALAAAAWPTMTPGLAGSAMAILSAVSRSLPPLNKGVVTDFDDMASYLLMFSGDVLGSREVTAKSEPRLPYPRSGIRGDWRPGHNAGSEGRGAGGHRRSKLMRNIKKCHPGDLP